VIGYVELTIRHTTPDIHCRPYINTATSRANKNTNNLFITAFVMELTETAFWHHAIDHAGCVIFTVSGIRQHSNSNSNLLKQQRAKTHLQVAKTMIKHATYAYYI